MSATDPSYEECKWRYDHAGSDVTELLDQAAEVWIRHWPTHEVPATSANPFLWLAENSMGRAIVRLTPPDPPKKASVNPPSERRPSSSHRLLHRLIERDGATCKYCGDPLSCPCDLSVPGGVGDHVMPKSRGGSDDDSNRALACWPCNSDKADRTPSEWGGR